MRQVPWCRASSSWWSYRHPTQTRTLADLRCVTTGNGGPRLKPIPPARARHEDPAPPGLPLALALVSARAAPDPTLCSAPTTTRPSPPSRSTTCWAPATPRRGARHRGQQPPQRRHEGARRGECAGARCRVIRLYRNRADYNGWFADESIHAMVLDELARGTWPPGPTAASASSILYDSANANGAVAAKLMRLDGKNSWCSRTWTTPRSSCFRSPPRARIVLGATGIGGVPVERVRELLRRYPTLVGELSLPWPHRRRRPPRRAVEGIVRRVPEPLRRRLRTPGSTRAGGL